MNVKYEFDNGEVTAVEVSEEFGAMIIDPRRKEESDNRKEHRHCYSLDTTASPPSDDGGGLSIREIVKVRGQELISKMPDSVWQIELVALLRTFNHIG